MSPIEDPRIREALELLDAVARDKKAELAAALDGNYAHLAALVAGLPEDVRAHAAEALEAGRQRAEEAAGSLDQSVRRNPYAYIGGAALLALALGFMLGRSRKD